jgi:hypothetical protein
MNEPDATFTNGRYELPPHARGVLVLADPPEAGWRIQTDSDAPAARAGLSGQGSPEPQELSTGSARQPAVSELLE